MMAPASLGEEPMDLSLSPEDRAFRDEVRAFAAEALPEPVKRKQAAGLPLGKAEIMAWHRTLHEKGWIAPNWPVEHRGAGFTPVQRHVFEREMARAGAPWVLPFGVGMVGPVIMAFGDAAQKARFLPRILSGADVWCQGYSEPGAGSDLAGLRTRAVRDGDHYVVDGQKTWTSYAHWADMIFCLVRTSTQGKPQEGISFLLIDMKSPGISVNPIVTIGGRHEVNDVFFDNVRVPAANRVGNENEGWTYAKYLLRFERAGSAEVGVQKRQVARLRNIARAERLGARPLIEDRRFAEKLADLEIQLAAIDYTEMRVLAAESIGAEPGPEVSMLKLRGTEIQQRISELLLEAIGGAANPYIPEALSDGWNEEPVGPAHGPGVAPHYFDWRKASIYAGSNEIQKNIMTKMVLGL